MVERIRDRDVASTLLNRHDELKLVVVVACHGRVRDRTSILDDAVCRFLEEDGWVPGLVASHFANVGDIVPSNAVDPSNWERLAHSSHWQKSASHGCYHISACVH